MKPIQCVQLVLCGVILVLPSCGPDPKLKALIEESEAQSLKISLLEAQTTQAMEAAKAAEKNLVNQRAEAEAREKVDKAAIQDLKEKAEEAAKALEDYKAKYRISARKKALTVKLDALDAGDEGKFSAVEIMAVNPAEVRFRHASGIASLPIGLLDEELRMRLGYDGAEAESWLAEQAVKKEQAAAEAVIAQSEAATAQIKKLGKPGNSGINVGLRNQLQSRLYSLNLSSRQLMLNTKCCQVHKKWQLGMWSKEIAQLRVQIARLPVVKGLE